MKSAKYIKDYYNKYYTNEIDFYWNKTQILNAFKTFENDYMQGKWLSWRMGIKGNEKVLDCGCGIGGVMKQLSLLHSDLEIHGINISDKQVEMAENMLYDFNNCTVSIQDFTNTNYKNNTFDIVYFCESICYSDYNKTLNEMYRILKPDGKLYIKDLVIKCPKDKLSKKDLSVLNKFIKSWYTEVYDIDTIKSKINKLGKFKLINTKKYSKPSINWINAVRKSDLKKHHNATRFNIPPIRGIDFLYKRG